MRAVLLACAFFLLPVAGGAQTSPQPPTPPPPTFRTGVHLVRVDVTVTARNQQPVADLTAADFDVKEDGVPQRIESLQFVRLTGQPSPGDDLSLEIRSPAHAAQEAARDDVRVLVLFVDDYHIRHGALFDHQLRRLLKRFVQAEMQPTDLFAVMGPMTPISDLGLTRDKEAILERINRLEGRLGGFVPPRSALEENQLLLNAGDLARIRAQITLSALQSLAVHLGGLREGRKSVLFISEGPPFVADHLSMYDHLRDVVTAANTSNVTIHTMDPRELGASTLINPANEMLAAETGGRRLSQSNDHSRGLRAVMADASAYYLLGYAPDRNLQDGKFHEIQVRVHRKGVRVLARKGYWAPGTDQMEAAAAPAAPKEITDVLASLALASRPRLVDDLVSVGPIEAGRSRVTIACASDTANTPADRIASVTTELIDDEDRVVEAAAAAPQGTEGVWIAQFSVGPGPRRVRLTARDAHGDTVDTWIRRFHVPASGDITARMGTPVVYRLRTVAAYKALTAGSGALTTDRHFRHTDRVVVRVPLSTDATASAIRAEIVNGRGQTLLALPVARLADGAPQVELPVASLAQAAYVLRLTATFDGTAASRLVPFAVVP
jgi:VWFA-related protein